MENLTLSNVALGVVMLLVFLAGSGIGYLFYCLLTHPAAKDREKLVVPTGWRVDLYELAFKEWCDKNRPKGLTDEQAWQKFADEWEGDPRE